MTEAKCGRICLRNVACGQRVAIKLQFGIFLIIYRIPTPTVLFVAQVLEPYLVPRVSIKCQLFLNANSE